MQDFLTATLCARTRVCVKYYITKAYWENEVYNPRFLKMGSRTQMEENGQLRAPGAVSSGWEPPVPAT